MTGSISIIVLLKPGDSKKKRKGPVSNSKKKKPLKDEHQPSQNADTENVDAKNVTGLYPHIIEP